MSPAVAPPTVALHDIAALRALETQAAAALGDDDALMQRAGEAGWRHVLQHWPQARRIVVACGPGNNGGDGYVLARHAWQAGREVRVVQVKPPDSALAARACAEFRSAGGRVDAFESQLPEADLVVDALLGIGLSRAPEGALASCIAAIAAQDAPVLALDVPSGVDADRGCIRGHAVQAARTLQLMAAHPGLATGAALDQVGACDLATLGVDPGLLERLPVFARALQPRALAGWLPSRRRDSHKGTNGHVLCIGGDHGSAGAIMLCVDAALRCGAGLASVATRTGHVAALLARRPEAMAHAVESEAGLAALCARADVIAVGPGLGKAQWGRDLLSCALSAGKSLVVDADALNLLAAQPRELSPGTILTPHPGEAARLLEWSDGARVQADRYAAAASLVARYRCVVVLKGAGTIVAAPGCTPFVIAAGNPGMAVGGMGDLLTGVIAALRAQGLEAFDAAACGALLHAVAGDVAAGQGQRGMLPSDLLPALRQCANPTSRDRAL